MKNSGQEESSLKPRTECTKVIYELWKDANAQVPRLEEKWGRGCWVIPCKEHGKRTVWHHTSIHPKRGSRNGSKGNPETIARNKRERDRKNRYRKGRLPFEVWENEGGALYEINKGEK